MSATDLPSTLSQLNMPMVNWDALALSLNYSEKQELAKELQAIGERSLRLASYLQNREVGHKNAVRAQNRDGRAIRKMIGFTYPEKADINF